MEVIQNLLSACITTDGKGVRIKAMTDFLWKESNVMCSRHMLPIPRSDYSATIMTKSTVIDYMHGEFKHDCINDKVFYQIY